MGHYVDVGILAFIQFVNAFIGWHETTKSADAVAALKASLKPRQGRNRFARAWKRAGEAQADARRRKHETSVALAVRDAKRRRRWAAAGAAARQGGAEI